MRITEEFIREFFGMKPKHVLNIDVHVPCRVTIRSVEQQRDTAFAMVDRLHATIIQLTDEVVRLSKLASPGVAAGDIEQPKSTRDSDEIAGVTLNDPERLRRPAPGPTRVDG